MILWVSLAVTIGLLLCRFMPGPKCLTYCKFRQLKFKAAREKLREMSIFKVKKINNQISEEVFTSLTTQHLSYDQMCRLYTNSRPYGCSELVQEQWFVAARNALRDAIAEKQLLE